MTQPNHHWLFLQPRDTQFCHLLKVHIYISRDLFLNIFHKIMADRCTELKEFGSTPPFIV